jgi:uncharacterized membrane protein HdeD (DUF308 family)
MRVVVGVSIAVVIAALWALVSQYSFAQGLHVTTLALGAILLLMGVMGRDTNFERRLDASAMGFGWNMVGLSHRSDDPTLRPGITLVLCGAALLAFAFFVAQ